MSLPAYVFGNSTATLLVFSIAFMHSGTGVPGRNDSLNLSTISLLILIFSATACRSSVSYTSCGILNKNLLISLMQAMISLF